MKLRVEIMLEHEDGGSYGFIVEPVSKNPNRDPLIMTSTSEVREEIQKLIDAHGTKYWYDVQEERGADGLWGYFGMVYQDEPGTWDWDLPEK